jgi:histidinol phosphatase-like enzyme (inositol monophosphatase family)
MTMLHRNRLVRIRSSIRENELHVHRIAVAQGDGGLQPIEPNLPLDAERIGSCLEFTEVLHSKHLNLKWLNLRKMTAFEKELEFGRDLAKKAGALALRYREGNIGIEIKSDESPVTIADKECEKLIVSAIEKAFPEDGVLGEEGATKDTGNGRRWIVDPIDGTRDFIRGTKAWSVLIGLEEDGEVVAGFAYFPATGELYSAALGRGAYWNDDRIQVSSIAHRSQALICVNGFSYMRRYPFSDHLLEYLEGCWTVRSMGGCLDSMLVASGRADGWIEAQAKPWDLAPLKIIAAEAGAITFDFTGVDTIYGGNYVICTPGMAEDMKALVTRGR